MMIMKIISHLRRTTLSYTIVRNMHKFNTEENHKFFESLQKDFGNVFLQPKNISKETWESIREHSLKLNNNLSSADFFILQSSIETNHPEFGIHYYKFLQNNNCNFGIVTTSLYLKLYNMKSDPITKAEKKHILNLCHGIIDQYQSLSMELANVLIESFCRVQEWEEAIKVMNSLDTSERNCNSVGYNIMITYMYNSGEIELGNKYLHHILKHACRLSEETCNAYLKYCSKNSDTFNENIEKLFSLWSKYGNKPNRYIVFKCMDTCNNHGWSAKPTIISRSICKVCKNDVSSEIYLTDNDYKKLSEYAKQKLISEQSCMRCNPKDIEQFMKFVDSKVPYDIVIDGLNNFYTCNEMFVNQLKVWKETNNKILVIGRRHIQKHFNKLNVSSIADCYFVKDASNDDLFALYAAFLSGREVQFLSKDLLRQHKFHTNDSAIHTVFQKWQKLHQYMLDNNRGMIKLRAKIAIDGAAQKHNDYWHIPYVLKQSQTYKSRHTTNNHWVCFKINK